MHPDTTESVIIKVSLRQKRRPVDNIPFYNFLIQKIARILGMVKLDKKYFNPNSPIIMPLEK